MENFMSGKTNLQSEGEIKILPGKQKLRDFVTTRPPLQK